MLSGLSFIVLCISIILFWCQANSKSIQKRVFYGRPRHKRSAESDVNGKIVNNIGRKCDDKRVKAPAENIRTPINSNANTNEIKDDYYYQSFNVVQEIFNELEPLENYEEITNTENIENGRQHYQLFNVEQELMNFNELEPIENYEDFCNPNNLANSDFCSRSKIHFTSTSNIFNDFYAAYKRDVNNFVADPYSGLTTL